MIALRPPRLDTAAALDALAAELALLRQMHALLNEEERVLAVQAASDAETASHAIEALALRRARLAGQLQAATRARAELFNRTLGSTSAAPNATAISSLIHLSNDAALQRMWRSVRAACTQIARRHQAHTHAIERYGQYLQSRWNGLLHSAGQARVYDRSGGAAQRQVMPSMRVSV